MRFIILLITCFLLSGCGYDEYKMPEDAYLNTEEKKITVYEEAHIYDLIKDTNTEILTKNANITTDIIGKKELIIEYKYEKRKYKLKVNYEVIDKTAPIFISAATSRTIKVNDDYYPCDEIVFGDNYDREPTCEIEGFYDLTTVGTYHVSYIIKDSSNNETKKNLRVNVVDEISKSNSSTTNKVTLPISTVIEDKKTEHTMIGIDVSRWQENIDFEKVKNAGVEFVIMRMGINSDIDKDISVDSYFAQNIEAAKNAGLKVGVYVYTTATNVDTAIEHAKWTLETLNGEQLDFPIAFDWENWNKFRKYGISIHDLNETFEAFAKTIKAAGYETMLYSSKFYLENIWDTTMNYPIWLAHYISNTNYEGDYFLWQMSNVGRVDGINGDVDIDILYKEKSTFN
ncbi:MAG: hypothetical protein J1F35_07255 [Erysipelotrichales bacterium]|nr:hypothetical protein [Erysipelotrichales bacterium]